MGHPRSPVWRRVHECAKSLTKQGKTPFTRQDLVECVRARAPQYGPDTINPIIQGLTDNLRGGAPGAVGRDLLHSVARGQFVLADSARSDHAAGCPQKSADITDEPPPPDPASPENEIAAALEGSPTTMLGGYRFHFVCELALERNPDGSIRTFHPQDRYVDKDRFELHQYGNGSFCSFRIPGYLTHPGVYALSTDTHIRYVGECKNLSRRFNAGYGHIAPRNCYGGGQETNCRINQLVFDVVQSNGRMSLWFLGTNDRHGIEADLRSRISLPWNRL